MATEITMPQMGFDMTEGVIAAWLKKEGEPVTKGEPIAEIETDKTTIQIESFASGVLRKIVAPAGQKVPVGQVIGIIADPDEVVDEPKPAMQLPTHPPQSPEAPSISAAAGAATGAADASGRVIATPVARRLATVRR